MADASLWAVDDTDLIDTGVANAVQQEERHSASYDFSVTVCSVGDGVMKVTLVMKVCRFRKPS